MWLPDSNTLPFRAGAPSAAPPVGLGAGESLVPLDAEVAAEAGKSTSEQTRQWGMKRHGVEYHSCSDYTFHIRPSPTSIRTFHRCADAQIHRKTFVAVRFIANNKNPDNSNPFATTHHCRFTHT